MKLSEILSQGKFCNKKAKLLTDVNLDNVESMKKGEIGSLVIDYGNGTYHFEHNDFACKVSRSEIEII